MPSELPERLDRRPRGAAPARRRRRPACRHRDSLHLEARLDDVAEGERGAQALAVALLRFRRVAADQRAVGEEVVGEVPRCADRRRPRSRRSRESASARAVSPSATSTWQTPTSARVSPAGSPSSRRRARPARRRRARLVARRRRRRGASRARRARRELLDRSPSSRQSATASSSCAVPSSTSPLPRDQRARGRERPRPGTSRSRPKPRAPSATRRAPSAR